MVALVQHRPRPKLAAGWTIIAALDVVNVSLAFGAMFVGIAGLATGTAAVLANAQPLLILLPAWWLYGERDLDETATANNLGVIVSVGTVRSSTHRSHARLRQTAQVVDLTLDALLNGLTGFRRTLDPDGGRRYQLGG